jgi:hypothetical protein
MGRFRRWLPIGLDGRSSRTFAARAHSRPSQIRSIGRPNVHYMRSISCDQLPGGKHEQIRAAFGAIPERTKGPVARDCRHW